MRPRSRPTAGLISVTFLSPLEVIPVKLRRRKAMSCCAGEHRQTAVRAAVHRTRATDRQRVAGVRAVRPRHDLRHDQGSRRRRPRRDRDGDQSRRRKQTRTTVTDGSGYYTFPNLHARPVRHHRRAPGVQEELAEDVQLDAAALAHPRLRARDRRAHRGGHGHRRVAAAADRRRAAQDRRSEGHRAAVVLRPQPDWRGRR